MLVVLIVMMTVIVLAVNPIVDANAILVVHVLRLLPDTFAGSVGAFAILCSVLLAAATTINNLAKRIITRMIGHVKPEQ